MILPEVSVILHRSDVKINWGFRFQGGHDFRFRPHITKITQNSSCYGKVNVGDTIVSINGDVIEHMNHVDIVNILKYSGLEVSLMLRKGEYNVARRIKNNSVVPTLARPNAVPLQSYLKSSQPSYINNNFKPKSIHQQPAPSPMDELNNSETFPTNNQRNRRFATPLQPTSNYITDEQRSNINQAVLNNKNNHLNGHDIITPNGKSNNYGTYDAGNNNNYYYDYNDRSNGDEFNYHDNDDKEGDDDWL
ncbi:hypothetical protein SNEBB_006662 [Seison nebaliae]|nr:hypothetical protein SNEBB_006662 [Seison nebaliae]